MALEKIRIDDGWWNDADELRRREWQIAVKESLADGELKFLPNASRLDIHAASHGYEFALRDSAGETLAAVEVPRDALSKQVQEYVDVVRQMERVDMGYGAARLEALDMAKKLTHDDAGRVLERLCAPLGVDHPTGRRLFTLLFTLRVDTSRLTGFRAHRPVR
ncbi:MAG: UPF0262 family protein [Polyangiales bacterium]